MRFAEQIRRLKKHIMQSIEENLKLLSNLPDGTYAMRTRYKNSWESHYGIKVAGKNAHLVLCGRIGAPLKINPEALPLEDAAKVADELLELKNSKKIQIRHKNRRRISKPSLRYL